MGTQANDHMYFWIRKMNSAISIVLILSFYMLYVLPMSKAADGPDGFDGLMILINSIPLIGWVEAFLIPIPLLLHTALMTMTSYSSSINVISYPCYRNWLYLAKRISGFVIIPFVVYHLFINRISYIFGKGEFGYYHILKDFAPLRVDIIYVVGFLCMAFYLGSSVESLFFEWGFATTPRSRRVLNAVMWIMASIFVLWGLSVLKVFV